MNPYASVALDYLGKGFSPLPLPYGRKASPEKGWTGEEGKWAGEEEVGRWSRGGIRNVCLRLPDGVLGIDIDAYAGKRGAETLKELERELGELPATWVSTSRRDDTVSGIYLYRVEKGRAWRDAGVGVETIRWAHRYAVVAPSKHPEGRVYGWRSPDGEWSRELAVAGIDELPELPLAWQQRLMKLEAVSEPAGEVGGAERHPYATRGVEAELVRLDDLDVLGWAGDGWDNTCFEVACNLIEFSNSAWSGWDEDELRDLYLDRAPVDEGWGAEQHLAKWESARKTVGGEGRREPDGDAGELGAWDGEGLLYDPWDVTGDANLGQRLAHDYLRGEFLAWGRGRWARWDGRRWDLEVTDDEVIAVARNALLDVLAIELGRSEKRLEGARGGGVAEGTIELAIETHEQRRRSLKRLRSLGAIQGALKIARGLLLVRESDFDGGDSRWLLNVGNGVVDLRTGELGEWKRELLFTRVTDVCYRPGARHEDWDRALEAIPTEGGVREWMQRRLGQAVTGFVPEDDVVPFWKGAGENGKSSVLTGLKRALGPFLTVVPDKVLTGGAGDHPTEFMTLKGARLAIIEELPGGDWLEDTRLKKVVGSESGMTARWIGQNNITWEPTHSLMVTTNHDVRVSDMTWGTWRRLARVEFPYRFDGGEGELSRERDGGLRARLARGEDGRAEAVLAWLVEGAVAVHGSGLVRDDMPEVVRSATLDWKLGGDPVVSFFREHLVKAREGEKKAVESALVYEVYADWAKGNGYRVVSAKELWARFNLIIPDLDLGGARKTLIRCSSWDVQMRVAGREKCQAVTGATLVAPDEFSG